MITGEHVRESLNRREEAALVVLHGRAPVVPEAELGSERFRGAVEVVSVKDLVERLGAEGSTDHDPDAVAGTLDAAVARQGG